MLDAHLEIDGADIRLYSRSGSTGSPTARNVNYSEGLRTVLAQLDRAGIRVSEAFVDSGRVQTMPLEERRILSPTDLGIGPDEQFTRLSQRMRRVGRTGDKAGGNNNKLIRLCTDSNSEGLKAALALEPVSINLRSANRIPDSEFRAIRADHVWQAVEDLKGRTDFTPYSPSKDYDVLLDDGERLPPKAVFGRAATLALGADVLPKHFAGGVGTTCFLAIENAGFPIVSKTSGQPVPPVPPSEDDWWAEGSPKLRRHMRRERARGLSRAKRSAFMSEHDGKLFCEECHYEPIEAHQDPLAEACIEVHHRDTAVSQMTDGHTTKLADLQCLCANCHRLVHARLREAEKHSAQ